MIERMELDKARKIVSDIVRGRKKYGKQISLPYTTFELLDAIVALNEAGNFDSIAPEEVTKLRRQLAACQNREKRRTGKIEIVEADRPE